MGAPLNTLAGALIAAYVIYAAKNGQLATLMQIIGLAGNANISANSGSSVPASGG